jgi:daunorubicin resistance ABC transporter membrane protein
MWRREMTLFLRQPARIAAALGTPALLWLFMGSGFAESFRPQSLGTESYASFLLPGMLCLVAVFASIFSSISIIEDRNAGWLQAVLASPAPRSAVASGKALGGATIAWLQAAVLLPVAPWLAPVPGPASILLAAALLAVTCVALSAMGLALAWRCETTAGFHGVMNLVFMPMWLLSGAFFPADSASPWLAAIMRANPLTWCTSAVRDAMSGAGVGGDAVSATAFAALMLAAAISAMAGRQRGAGVRS